MYEIRAARDDDDLDAYNDHDPRWLGAGFARAFHDSVPPGRPRALLVAEAGGHPAGYGHLFGVGVLPGGFGAMRVAVRQDLRGQGLGGRIRDGLLSAAGVEQLPGYGGWADEDDAASMRVLGHWGFVAGRRHHESELDLTSLDGVLESAGAKARAAGITLVPLPPTATDHDWRRALAFLADRWVESPDSTEEAELPTYEFFRGQFDAPWQVLLALADGDPVGITTVSTTGPTVANTFFTGVRPDFRGRGIATALKAEQARVLREHGVTLLVTQNMDVNAHILAANDRLGFRRRVTFVEMLRPRVAG